MLDTTVPGNVSPTATLLVIAFVVMVFAGGLAWALVFWRAQRRAGAAAAASVTTGVLPARGSVVLYGTVETEEPERPAVTVTLWEHGEEQEQKNGWSHTWTEQRRETKAEPFYLRLSGASAGTVVRVEPDDDVFLVDALDSLEQGNPRVRRAQLTTGEQAFVSGVLGRGWVARSGKDGPGDVEAIPSAHGSAYRGGPTEGLVLRAGRERMLVSTEPLQDRYVRQAKAHRLFAFIFGLALAFTLTIDFGTVIVTEIFGRPVDADITAVRHWTTSGKGGPSDHYGATARYTSEAGAVVVLDTEIQREVYDAYQAKRNTRVPFVVAFDRPALSSLGTRVTTDAARVIATFFVTLLSLFLYRSALRGAREWYDQRRVVTRGAGRLPVYTAKS